MGHVLVDQSIQFPKAVFMNDTKGKLLVGYFPGSAIHARNYHVSDIPAKQLTHVVYASADINSSGVCESLNPQDDQINFPALQTLKQQSPGLKVLISIGGASNSKNFSKSAKTPTSRHALAQSCLAFMKASGLDGIDIDWEFPSSSTEKQEFTELLKELRSQLDVQGTTDRTQYLLTAALPATPDHYGNVDLNQVQQFLDWINLKAFDFYSPSSSPTHFSSPMNAQSGDPETNATKRKSYNVDSAVQAYLAAGVPAIKLVLGISFSGQGWKGVPNVANGLYQTAGGPAQGTWQNDGLLDFSDIASNYAPTYTRFWSSEASVPWLYNPATNIFISYEDPQSVGLKARYANAKNLGGVMIPHLTADDAQSSLLNAVTAVLNPAPQPAATAVLTCATRSIAKATLVPLDIPISDDAAGRAMLKFGYVRQLSLQPGEVAAVRKSLAAFADSSLQSKAFYSAGPLWDLLAGFEGQPMPSLLPSASEFADIPVAALQTVGKAIAGLRKQTVDQVGATLSVPSALGASDSPVALIVPKPGATEADLGKAQQLLNLAAVANRGLEVNTNVSPIGMLNLERLEVAPAGIEKGELIATIPLAPGERTAVVQKEWSVTTKEFTSIVTDSLETYSETGVTDNTELSQSTTSQIQHANQFNITGTVSGGIPLISGSVNSTFGAQDSASQSATDSRKHAVTVTQKASSRAKQEHKVTISTTTVTGTSETTTRELVNPSTTDPIRVDYFRLMRKWRVRLYRYGLRLTYDIVIPEPAGALRKAYADLEKLRSKIGPFVFNVPLSEVTADKWPGESEPHYLVLAQRYSAQVPLHPESIGPLVFTYSPTISGGANFTQLSFTVPPGYWITDITFDGSMDGPGGHNIGYGIVGTTFFKYSAQSQQTPFPSTLLLDNIRGQAFLLHAEGAQNIMFLANNASAAAVQLTVKVEPAGRSLAQWQLDVWNALYNAAQTQYYAHQQDLAAQISQIEDQLNNVDTLTLRREESDEIMKGVLCFILGPGFDYMPQAIIDAIKASSPNSQAFEDAMKHGVAFLGNDQSLGAAGILSIVRQYEDKVRFINQAIEWENVVSFLYSYFWDVPDSWDFIRQIKHPDANRQAFLRAGSARVVLTVRKGWETAWTGFVDSGIPGGSSPYFTIAQEIAAYDDRNYPGIPPANPEQSAVRLEDAVFTRTMAEISPSSDPNDPSVVIPVESSAGFLVGAQVVIDSRVDLNAGTDSKQESQIIIDIPDGQHITVQQLANSHGGDREWYPIVQPGEKGALIAEWNEYTPTSGTDIAVTSNLTTIA
jgi:GH18 family chitinase